MQKIEGEADYFNKIFMEIDEDDSEEEALMPEQALQQMHD